MTVSATLEVHLALAALALATLATLLLVFLRLLDNLPVLRFRITCSGTSAPQQNGANK